MSEKTLAQELFGIRSKRGINSQKKGKKNEQQLAKKVSEWVGVPFKRVPMSGGMRGHKRSDYCGDITCADEDFYFDFTIETKFVNSITKKRGGFKSNIKTFWLQATEDALRADKHPILFARENEMPKDTWYVFIDDNSFNISKFKHWGLPIREAGISFNYNVDIYYIHSERFFEIPYTDLVKLLKT